MAEMDTQYYQHIPGDCPVDHTDPEPDQVETAPAIHVADAICKSCGEFLVVNSNGDPTPYRVIDE